MLYKFIYSISSCHTFSSNSRGKKSYFAIKLFCFSLTKIDPVILVNIETHQRKTFLKYNYKNDTNSKPKIYTSKSTTSLALSTKSSTKNSKAVKSQEVFNLDKEKEYLPEALSYKEFQESFASKRISFKEFKENRGK